jgi:hypothetical protein
MPVNLDFLRGVLGMLAVFFAHMLGRSAAAVGRGQQKRSRLYAWIIRTAVCAGAVALRHRVDFIDIGVWAMAGVSFALGWWAESRPRKEEDLSGEIFHGE